MKNNTVDGNRKRLLNREQQLVGVALAVTQIIIGVNFYKAARLEPPHFLGSKAFRPLSPPTFSSCVFSKRRIK